MGAHEEQFWKVISRLANEDEPSVLAEGQRDELVQWFQTFELYKADLFEVIQERFSDDELSDDTIEDLADAVITMGQSAFSECLAGSIVYPERAQWENLPTVGYLFVEVFYERFGESIVEQIE